MGSCIITRSGAKSVLFITNIRNCMLFDHVDSEPHNFANLPVNRNESLEKCPNRIRNSTQIQNISSPSSSAQIYWILPIPSGNQTWLEKPTFGSNNVQTCPQILHDFTSYKPPAPASQVDCLTGTASLAAAQVRMEFAPSPKVQVQHTSPCCGGTPPTHPCDVSTWPGMVIALLLNVEYCLICTAKISVRVTQWFWIPISALKMQQTWTACWMSHILLEISGIHAIPIPGFPWP